MDLVSVASGITNNYRGFYNNQNNFASLSQVKNNSAEENSTNSAKNIIIVKKGSTGYMTDVDFDDDGKITLEEFNKYCEENGVSEKDKMKLMTTMEFSKVKEALINKNVEESIDTTTDESKNSNEEEENSVYAKKGDEKYNDAMDNNKDNVVTYAEYVKYCMDRAENNEKNSSKENNKYSNQGKSVQDDELVSTVEYEV